MNWQHVENKNLNFHVELGKSLKFECVKLVYFMPSKLCFLKCLVVVNHFKNTWKRISYKI